MMRILYLFPRTPYPVNSGDTVRNAALLQLVRSVADRLDVITLPQPPGPDADAGLATLIELADDTTVVGEPLGELLKRPSNRIATLAGRPYHDSVANESSIRSAIGARLRSHPPYDHVILSQLFMFPAIPRNFHAKTIFDTHNVEHLRIRAMLQGASRATRALSFWVAPRIAKLESQAVSKSRLTLACSEPDRSALLDLSPGADVRIVANGVTSTTVPRAATDIQKHRVLFLASLDYSANIDSLRYLISEILPLLDAEVELTIAGSNPRPEVNAIVQSASRNVTYLGQVADAAALMRESAVLVVPVRLGGGTRLKVLEAMNLGVPVVSTSKGCEGIPLEAGREYLRGDSPSEFAAAVNRLVRDDALASRTAQLAHRAVARDFDWNITWRPLKEALHQGP